MSVRAKPQVSKFDVLLMSISNFDKSKMRPVMVSLVSSPDPPVSFPDSLWRRVWERDYGESDLFIENWSHFCKGQQSYSGIALFIDRVTSTWLLLTQTDCSPSRHCQSVSNDDALLEEWLKDQEVYVGYGWIYVCTLHRNATFGFHWQF